MEADNRPRCVVDMDRSNLETGEYALVPGWFDFDVPREGFDGWVQFFHPFEEGMILSVGGIPDNWILFGAVNSAGFSREEVAKALSVTRQTPIAPIDIDRSNSEGYRQ